MKLECQNYCHFALNNVGGLKGQDSRQFVHLKFCCFLGMTKLSPICFGSFAVKLECQNYCHFSLKNVMGVCGGNTLADFPQEGLLWFLKDKTIADVLEALL